MKRSMTRSASQSHGMSSGMPSFVPDLLKGMWTLGGSPELVVNLLLPLGLPRISTRILDLGCGKGAVSVTVAEKLGFQAVGVDICAAFLEEAGEKAAEHNVSSLCRFELADLRDYVRNAVNFDVTVLAHVGGVIGRLDKTIATIRGTLKPGGYMVVDSGFFKTERIKKDGYAHIFTHEETIQQLNSYGDRLIKEILTVNETKRTNDLYLSIIRKNASDLILKNPSLKFDVEQYVRAQDEECSFMNRNFTGAIWLLQRKDD